MSDTQESTIGMIRKTPTVLYGIFVELARQVFSPEFQTVAPTWIWAGDGNRNTDRNKSKIWIDTEYKWNDEAPDFRPAVYVGLAPVTYNSLNNRQDGGLGMDMRSGEYDYSRGVNTAVRFTHIGSTAGEGLRVAEQTMDYFDAFAPVIRKEYCFRKFRPAGFEPAQPYQASERTCFRSVVTFEIGLEETWTLKLEAPLIRKIVFSAGQPVSGLLCS